MKWIVIMFWAVICFFGILVSMMLYLVSVFLQHIWDFKIHKYSWREYTREESWCPGDSNPLDTYKRWIKYDIHV